MWIAKPLRALDAAEQIAWCQTLFKSKEPPLAQSLAWGRAIQAVGGKVYVVFSPDELVGGLIFETQTHTFECINGPLLDWDHAAVVTRQLATFADAVTRLDPHFAQLRLRPRWRLGEAAHRLPHLPLSATSCAAAATMQIQLARGTHAEAAFRPRLRRTLRLTDQAGVVAHWEDVGTSSLKDNLVEFVLALQAFGRAHGFTVPPLFWFKALLDPRLPDSSEAKAEHLRFGLVSAHTSDGAAGCQLLIAWHGPPGAGEAHYLFGHEWRAEQVRSAISPAAAAHRLAIRRSAEAGLGIYDLNGYLEKPAADHAYAGVSEFKAQFGGAPVAYEVPEIRITP